MSYLPPINTLWDHASHPSKRAWSRSPSPEPAHHDTVHTQAGPSTQLTPLRQAAIQRRLVRQSTRGDHLPMRTRSAEQARLLRALKGYPPIGSSADADQLSDLEESIEVGRFQMVRFGERYIVQIGRRRTMREEELSNEEDDGRRAGFSAVDAGLSFAPEGGVLPAMQDASLQTNGGDNEGITGPGLFVGGHTGHAQAEFNQRRIAEAERRARDAEAGANRAAAAAEAARSQAERQAAFQEEQDAVDLDADVEDLDEGDDEVDFD
ncbi:uncharacterized protein UMAG_11478 [Mycosarcoma maydis]|uniref:Uncharacterized protein n=1 Tax=Mycosarcoma maydis TaxID=5270 RepID=A0A0D1C596_MYCMD|nr:uncharacterized protein UMAG_11478 [Ustilago maydis 521]KIS68847.1 hypothetical protein UMAG_11478 [Ustilago maydis 521]|eukprot:XP_011389536.1 hypothetical protein UMAG_11478 [Ustilago maydis 521]